MILVSLHPFAFRKIFLLALALLGFSSAFCFADSVFMTRHYAPSHDQGRRGQGVIDPSANVSAALIWQSFERSDVTRCDEMGTVSSMDTTLADAGLESGQLLSTRIVVPVRKSWCVSNPVAK